MLNPNNNFEHFDITFLPEELRPLLPYARKRSIRKGDCLIEEGIHCNYFFLVIEGVFRTFRTANDKECITGFTFPGDIDGSAYSFFIEQPANETIQALTDAQILVFFKRDFMEMKRHHPSLETFIFAILANYIEILQNRILQHQSITAEERYMQLLEQQPHQMRKISLTYIASFLGISIERLSRIRKMQQI